MSNCSIVPPLIHLMLCNGTTQNNWHFYFAHQKSATLYNPGDGWYKVTEHNQFKNMQLFLSYIPKICNLNITLMIINGWMINYVNKTGHCRIWCIALVRVLLIFKYIYVKCLLSTTSANNQVVVWLFPLLMDIKKHAFLAIYTLLCRHHKCKLSKLQESHFLLWRAKSWV